MNISIITAKIDGQAVNILTAKGAVDACSKRFSSGQGFSFLTLNLDHLVHRRSNNRFRKAYARATFISADGQPIVKLAALQGVKLERTTGADLVMPLCGAASSLGVSVYLFGTAMSTLHAAVEVIQVAIPKIDIAGCSAPEFNFDPDGTSAFQYAEKIASSGAQLCFVALPAIKATYFIDRFQNIYPHIGFIGVGAALEFLALKQSRAPMFIQNFGFEWLWRLAANPRLMFRRYWSCGILYLKLRAGL